MRRFAFFITPHGYGHASRAAAVMEAVYRRAAEQGEEACFEIFTHVPVWFFNMSLRGQFVYHDVMTDIGLAQATSMAEDLDETLRRLDDFLPFREPVVKELAQQVVDLGCEKIICDIAPLGIAVAREAGLPSILVENFTWDWIYEGYLSEEPRFAPHIAYLRDVFASAGTHIQTIPACLYCPDADLVANVVSRQPRNQRQQTREALGIPQDAPLVMITMGGIVTQYPFLDRLIDSRDALFLIPGGSDQYEKRGSLILIPHHSRFFHPDLVEASDAVIGKLGYSTLAEAYNQSVPFAFVPRARFRESGPMGDFAREKMGAVELSESRFFSGAWLDLLPDLLARKQNKPAEINGADQIAASLL
ncbi:MAG: hypothetical protein GX491_17555 [Chloroflexi bacterium]|nr:hypothetical protein [Chloroflexota bacterium]